MMEPFDPRRFVTAQAPVYDEVRAELQAGRKRTHWMWFIFPQLAGLGRSATARHYALASLDDARDYLAHPVLGPRLIECTTLVNRLVGRSVLQIFGEPDHLKFHSSMTLFDRAAPGETPFAAALAGCFDGRPDPLTIALLRDCAVP